MTAYPTIINVIATKPSTGASSVTFLASIENAGTQGAVLYRAYNKNTGSCVEVSNRQLCLGITNQPYITSLYKLVTLYASGVIFDIGCMRAYNCSVGDVCSPPSCTTYNTSPNTSAENIVVDYGLGVTPNPVSGLSLTPGNGSINVSWSPPTNAPIFCYGINLFQGTTLIGSGVIHTTNTLISNLTNGLSYTVEIVAISDDGYPSNITSGSSTPIAPCPSPTVTMTII